MALFANALLTVLIIGLIIAFFIIRYSITTELESRLQKASLIAPFIHGSVVKSYFKYPAGSPLVETVVIQGKWRQYDTNIILYPSYFKISILFSKLSNRGFWFVSFPKTVDNNIIWAHKCLLRFCKYDDFLNTDDIFTPSKLFPVFTKLEQEANKLIITHSPKPSL
ncbi:hypothetical protein [Agitococcus lubricus]|uniref:Uncharacterized protein n=1 Tax=Agitococcus lubricus TaxID=1077255 RepID=A0A2T5J069_9GAMM|nr:hypothetical protein [Agitococcus lubricus]PTQ89734.1 hypothetical protein C8N29_10558 [Agitococcus lubricus]